MVKNVFIMNDKLVSHSDLYDSIESFKLKQQFQQLSAFDYDYSRSQMDSSEVTGINQQQQNISYVNGTSYFSLSKPFLLNLLVDDPTMSPVLTMQSKFTFVEPFESCHVGGQKMKTPSSMASNHFLPYTKSKPTAEIKTTSNLAVVSSSLNALSAVSKNESNTTSDIFARLSSISNSFKSIFVRPKVQRHVNFELFTKRIGTHTDQSLQFKQKKEFVLIDENNNTAKRNFLNKFKINLFSNNNQSTPPTVTIDQSSPDIKTNSFKINQRHESIINQNVEVSQAQKINSTSSNISKISSARSSITKSNPTTSQTHQIALRMSKNKLSCEALHSPSPTPHDQAAVSTSSKKWTCLVCLNKHMLNVEFCSICGSSSLSSKDTLNIAKSASQLSVPSRYQKETNEMGFEIDWKNNDCGIINNYMLKTWKCSLCNFFNDRLKIVCMHCRAPKKFQQQYPMKQTYPVKRSRQFFSSTDCTNNTMNLRLSIARSKPIRCHDLYDDNDLLNDLISRAALKLNEQTITTEDVNTKRAKYCSNCSCFISSKSGEADSNVSIELVSAQMVTPVKPVDFDTKYPTAMVYAGPTTPKSVNILNLACSEWTCAKCSTSNNGSKANCVSCLNFNSAQVSLSSVNEMNKPEINSIKWSCAACLTQNNESNTLCSKCSKSKVETKLNELIAISTSKWTCSTCLIINESEKTTCVCCSNLKHFTLSNDCVTSKTDELKTKFSKLVDASNSFPYLNKDNITAEAALNIRFGIQNTKDLTKSTSNQPIKFGCSFSLSSSCLSNNSVNEISKSVISFGSKTVFNQQLEQKHFGLSSFSQNNSTTSNETSKPQTANLAESTTSSNSLFSSTNKPQNSFAPSSNNSTISSKNTEKEEQVSTVTAPVLFKFGLNSSKTSDDHQEPAIINSQTLTNITPNNLFPSENSSKSAVSSFFSAESTNSINISSNSFLPSSGVPSNLNTLNSSITNVKFDKIEPTRFFGSSSCSYMSYNSNINSTNSSTTGKPNQSINFSLSNAKSGILSSHTNSESSFSFEKSSNQIKKFSSGNLEPKISSTLIPSVKNAVSSNIDPQTVLLVSKPFGNNSSQTTPANATTISPSIFGCKTINSTINVLNTVSPPAPSFGSFNYFSINNIASTRSTLTATTAANVPKTVSNINNNATTDKNTSRNFLQSNTDRSSSKSLFSELVRPANSMFGSMINSSSNPDLFNTDKNSTDNTNLFSHLNQSKFKYGQQSQIPFQALQSTQQPFVFASTALPFNFQSSKLIDTFSTPHKALGFTSSPLNNSPGQFVFSGLSSSDQASAIVEGTPYFQKLFTPDTTPSIRQYKKPTRRFKK